MLSKCFEHALSHSLSEGNELLSEQLNFMSTSAFQTQNR